MIKGVLVYWGMTLISLIFMLFFVLIGVAYLTMLERKILGYIQNRKGPNKVGFLGILQPFSDAVKLLTKEDLIVFKSNYFAFYLAPMMIMFLMLINWMVLPWITNIYCVNYSMLLIFVFMSVGGYMVMLSGWSSNSSFSLMGSIRFIAQSVSYEVSFILIIYCVMIMGESYSLGDLLTWQYYVWNVVTLFPLFLVFFISSLAELNRSPMDLIEGESELVSGFNIEYFSGSFALIFLGEYGMIMFLSFVITLVFTGSYIYTSFFVSIFLMMVVLVIYVRGVLPRVRYDELMYLCWKIILPVTLSYLMLVFGLKFTLFFLM